MVPRSLDEARSHDRASKSCATSERAHLMCTTRRARESDSYADIASTRLCQDLRSSVAALRANCDRRCYVTRRRNPKTSWCPSEDADVKRSGVETECLSCRLTKRRPVSKTKVRYSRQISQAGNHKRRSSSPNCCAITSLVRSPDVYEIN